MCIRDSNLLDRSDQHRSQLQELTLAVGVMIIISHNDFLLWLKYEWITIDPVWESGTELDLSFMEVVSQNSE